MHESLSCETVDQRVSESNLVAEAFCSCSLDSTPKDAKTHVPCTCADFGQHPLQTEFGFVRFESQWISSEPDLVEVACDSTKWKKEIADRVPDGHPAVLVLASPVQPVGDPGVLVLALLGRWCSHTTFSPLGGLGNWGTTPSLPFPFGRGGAL